MESAQGKLLPGSVDAPAPFGKYLLCGLIARGGMAEVFRAKARHASDRLLAIKCMRPQLAKEPRFVEMFIREGKLAVLLEHDAIVRTYEIGRIDGRYFIAMEYIGGKDMTQILRRCQESSQRIPVPHACYIGWRICEGLHYAHTRSDAEGRALNIVNRDISPSNVRISYDGDVKLLDFGIAQAMLKFTSEIGLLKGKFSYMSPEQIRGMPVDARTDVFSSGIILHEMLTTEKLFRGDTEFALMEKVRKAEVPPPSAFNRRVPEALDRIVLKALKRDLQDRYASARELGDELKAFMAQYRFDPGEMREFVRGLFRRDYQTECEEMAACQRDLGTDPTPEVGYPVVIESAEPGEPIATAEHGPGEHVLDGHEAAADGLAERRADADAAAAAAPSVAAPSGSPGRRGLWARLRARLGRR